MTILLVRHARAGRRDHWDGDDRLRPLSHKGRAQAERLPALLIPRLAGAGMPRLISSPWVRCTETLGPLARALGLAVVEDDSLGEGMGPKTAQSLPAWLAPPPTVVCTHGDVIAHLLWTLDTAGVDLGPEPKAAKGSAWLLDGDDGTVRSACYLPPPL